VDESIQLNPDEQKTFDQVILPVLGLHDTSKILDKISMEKKMVRLNPTKLLAT
jgi:hypothetical protein